MADEIDLTPYIEQIARRYYLIFFGIIAGGLLAYTLSLSTPDLFTSRTIIVSKTASDQGGRGDLVSRFGGLGALTGIGGVGLNVDMASSTALKRLSTLDFFRKHLYEETLVHLMGINGWDAGGQISIYDNERFDIEAKTWLLGKPVAMEAYGKYTSSLEIMRSEDGFIELSFKHRSPRAAQDVLKIIVRKLDSHQRARDIEAARRSLEFLYEKQSETNNISMQATLADLIESETRTVMMANHSEAYRFEVIEPPLFLPAPVSPNRAFIAMLGSILGGAASIFFLGVFALRNVKRQRST